MKRIHIIGGASGIGKWLAEKVFSNIGETLCYDLSLRHLELMAPQIQKCHLTEPNDFSSYTDNFQVGDWILFVVPQPSLEGSIKSLRPQLKPGSLFVVSTSTQAKSLAILTENTPSNCSCLGFHPLFGPSITSPTGQLAALTGYNDELPRHIEFHDALTRTGLVVSKLSAEQHDKSMALVQALTHFCLIGFASTIASNDIPASELLKLKTPNFQFLFAFASRVLKLTPTTTGSIQCTLDAFEIREHFLSTLKELHRAFCESETVENAAAVIERFREPLAGAEVDEGVETAAIAVDSLQRFEELLHSHKYQDRPFVFFHRMSGKVHVVRITNIRVDEIDYEESTKILDVAEKRQLAVGLFETARTNYRAIGINIRMPQKATIRKRNIKLLTHNEYQRFYRDKVLPISKFLSFNNPHHLTEQYIEEVLPLAISGLWRIDFVESYRKRNEAEKINVVVHLNPNCDISVPIAEVRLAIENGKLTPRSTGARL